MAVAARANLQALAAAVLAHAGQALVTGLASAAIVQTLVEGGDLAAERLCLLPVELAVLLLSICGVFTDALRELVDPSELARVGREVAEGWHVQFKVAFFLRDIPLAVEGAHNFHGLVLFNSPAQIVVDGAAERGVVTLEDRARDLFSCGRGQEEAQHDNRLDETVSRGSATHHLLSSVI